MQKDQVTPESRTPEDEQQPIRMMPPVVNGPHSTPTIIRVAPLNRINIKNHLLDEQDMAQPDDLPRRYSRARYAQRPRVTDSVSSSQIIQLYRNGLNIRPNTPAEINNYSDYEQARVIGPSQISQYSNPTNQAYLNIQEKKYLPQFQNPLAPFGTKQQSAHDLNQIFQPSNFGSISPGAREENSRIQTQDINAPINTINQRSPPSISSPQRPIRVSVQRQNIVPLMSRASQEPVSRQLNTQLQPSAASHSPYIPEIPPNTNTENGTSSVQELTEYTLSNGFQTTMAQTSHNDGMSDATLSGVAGLRPQNLFHRDEMFQIYLQRPPPPSPLRNRNLVLTNQNSSEERPVVLINRLQLQQSAYSSDIDADLVDELDKALKLNQTVKASPEVNSPPDEQIQQNTQIYHDVIENQHRSNQLTLKGYERVLSENDALKRQMTEMQTENVALRNQIKQMERLMVEHSLRCPILGDIKDIKDEEQYSSAREGGSNPIQGISSGFLANTYRLPQINVNMDQRQLSRLDEACESEEAKTTTRK